MYYYYYPQYPQFPEYNAFREQPCGCVQGEQTLFLDDTRQFPAGMPVPTGAQAVPGVGEQSFIENILRFNKGKVATFFLTYENNNQWNAQVLRGRIETAGRDHLIISDPESGKRYLLQIVNLDWVEFDEPVTYIRPEIAPSVQGQLTSSD